MERMQEQESLLDRIGVGDSLRTKLMLLFVLLAVVPVGIATFLGVQNVRSAIEEQVGTDRAELAEQVALRLDRVVYERIHEIRSHASNGELVAMAVGAGDSTATRDVLAGIEERGDVITGALLYDKQGKRVAANDSRTLMRADARAGGADWFVEGSDPSTPAYVGPVERVGEGEFRVRLAEAVTAANGSSLGVLVLDLDWDALMEGTIGELEQRFVEKLGEPLRAYVVDGDGTIVGSTRPDEILEREISGTEAFAALGRGEIGQSVEGFLDHEEALVSYAPIEGMAGESADYAGFLGGDAGMVMAERAGAAFAAASSLRNWLILASLLVGALAVAIAWPVSGRIARPLVEATEAAERLAVGDTDQEIPEVESDDEVGRLNEALRDLTAYMRELTEAARKVGRGDMSSVDLEPKSEKDDLSRAFDSVASTNARMQAELGGLIEAARRGRLEKRGDASRFDGGFAEVVEGLNSMLDAILEPIEETRDVIGRLADGDFTQKVEGDYQGDYAQLKKDVNRTVERLRSTLSQIQSASETVASSSSQVEDASHSMSDAAKKTNRRSESASAATEQASSNVELVASAAEEMSSSIREISEQVQEAAKVSNRAAEEAEETVEVMEDLGDSSQEIGEVVEVITSIAEQTNLLALNATIEAARAGEAGKGFAVVANEVKELASQTAKATEDIADRINGVQERTGTAVEGIQQVSDVIEELENISTNIAGAVEEQNAAVSEIARSASEASQGTEEVTRNIATVSDAAETTAGSAEELRGAAAELSGVAGQLQQLVAEFELTNGRHNGAGSASG